MTRSERDLVVALRSELAGIDPARPCDRLAEAAGLGDDAWNREAAVTRLAVRLERRAVDRDGGAVPDIDWAAVQDHGRWAWLRGRFLARGSLSLASGRTHLEFIVEPEEAPILAERLAGMGLPAAWRLRRGRGVVTWKSGEAVGTFLRRIGAGAALLELEARQVSRALRGEINRVINAESANLHRAVAAAGRQLDAIDRLEASGVLAAQPRVVRAVAAARRATPEATLSDLAERLELHRSAVQRALERLERLALDDGTGEPSAAADRTARAGGPVGPRPGGLALA